MIMSGDCSAQTYSTTHNYRQTNLTFSCMSIDMHVMFPFLPPFILSISLIIHRRTSYSPSVDLYFWFSPTWKQVCACNDTRTIWYFIFFFNSSTTFSYNQAHANILFLILIRVNKKFWIGKRRKTWLYHTKNMCYLSNKEQIQKNK